MPRLFARLRALSRDRKAATIIEFAVVAAPFIALILATIQTSLVFFAQQALETTAEQTARQLLTGEAQKAGLDKDKFRTLACQNLLPIMSCASMMIDVQHAASFSDVDTAAPLLHYDSKGNIDNSWQFDPGSPNDIVVMRVMYLFPVVGGPLGFNLADAGDGKRLLVATSVFQPEPYLS